MSFKTTVSMRNLRYQMQKIKQYPHYRRECKQIEQRKAGNIAPQFRRLQALQNTHAGERCFLVANRSGLTATDLEKLTHEITFGVEDAFLPDESWKPTYAGIQNPRTYRELEARIPKQASVFVGDNLAGMFALSESLIQFPYLGVYKYYTNRYGEYGARFSGNALEVVYDGYSVIYSMLQIAVYMGFREIYLFGCDCGQAQNQRLAAAYPAAKQYAEAHGIALVNCTHGESAGVFPYRDLTEVLHG